MFTRLFAAVVAVLVATTASLPSFAADEKLADECSKYLDKMTNDLDTPEALVPNVPPEEASYLEKEYAAAITSGVGTRIYAIEHRPLFPAWNVHNEFHSARDTLLTNRPTVGSIKWRI
jgi:hypothetical protein